MALQACLPSYFPINRALGNNSWNGTGLSVTSLDLTGERLGFVFRAPKAGTLAKVHFGLGAVVDGQTLKVSFQSVVDAGSYNAPDGTVDQFRTVTTTTTTDNGTWKITGIMSDDGSDTGVKRVVTKGEQLAIVIEFDATVGDVDFGVGLYVSQTMLQREGYHLFYNGSAWGSGSNQYPCWALEYDDGSIAYVEGLIPIQATGSGLIFKTVASWSSASTPDEQGIYFKFPFKCKIDGAWFGFEDAPVDIVLYDSDGSTVLETVNVDHESHQDPFTKGMGFRPFTAEHTLEADTFYRLVYKGITAVSTYYFEIATAALMEALIGTLDCYQTERTDAGAWTETTTKLPIIGVRVSALDDGVGGGGGGIAKLAGDGGGLVG